MTSPYVNVIKKADWSNDPANHASSAPSDHRNGSYSDKDNTSEKSTEAAKQSSSKKYRAPPPPPSPSLDLEDSDEAVAFPYVNVTGDDQEKEGASSLPPTDHRNGVHTPNESNSNNNSDTSKNSDLVEKEHSGEDSSSCEDSSIGEVQKNHESKEDKTLDSAQATVQGSCGDFKSKEENKDRDQEKEDEAAFCVEDHLKEHAENAGSVGQNPESDISIYMLHDIEALSAIKPMDGSEDGLVKEVLTEISTTMRKRKEEEVDISIRRSLRKSTVSDLSTEEILSELSVTDIIFITDNVQPVKMPSDADSVSSSAVEDGKTVHHSQGLDQGLVLSVQKLEEMADKDVSNATNHSPEDLDYAMTAADQLTADLVRSKSADELADSPSENIAPNRMGVDENENVKSKSASQHSLGRILSFRETTNNIELGAYIFFLSINTVFNILNTVDDMGFLYYTQL